MIKVSVIMPVYNVEEYLDECLKSVVNQTLKEIEIICINDGSTDESLAILQKYAEVDERIRVIVKANTGYGHSVNLGIDMAKGDYISVVESDDFVDSTMLEELYNLAIQNNLDMIKADSRYFLKKNGVRIFHERHVLPEEYKDLYNKVTNYHEDNRVFRAYLYTWAGIYKRQFLKEKNIRHNETAGASYQDNGFWFQVTIHAKRMYFLNRAFYNLRRDNLASSFYSKEKVFALCDEYDFIKDKILQLNSDDEKELLRILFYFRVQSYKVTLNRIDKKYHQIFYDKMRKDFKHALENGEVDCCQFNSSDWNYIYTVLNYEEICNIEFSDLNEMVKFKIVNSKDIYIYGAGVWGEKVLFLLRQCWLGDKIKGFVVTQIDDRKPQKEKLEVYQLRECNMNKDDLVIVAVSDNIMGQLINNLREIGHVNFITKNMMFFK